MPISFFFISLKVEGDGGGDGKFLRVVSYTRGSGKYKPIEHEISFWIHTFTHASHGAKRLNEIPKDIDQYFFKLNYFFLNIEY